MTSFEDKTGLQEIERVLDTKTSKKTKPGKTPKKAEGKPAKAAPGEKKAPDAKEHPLFLHLPHYDEVHKQFEAIGFADHTATATDSKTAVHPAMVELGLLYMSGAVRGSNARCVALLTALKQMVKTYETPADKAMGRDFDSKLKPNIAFIKKCRPMSVSMGNAIKEFKLQIHQIDPSTPDHKAKDDLVDWIDNFIKERITYADKLIAESGASRISNGDVILTYAHSSVVAQVLVKAKEDGKQFRVIVLDSKPLFEGRSLLKHLNSHGIDCSYAMVTAVSHMMKEVSKVMIGAHSLLCNGNLVSRAGTAGVAMMAHTYNKPVIVCCETYKFSEKAQLDAICSNELGNADAIAQTGTGKIRAWRHIDNLKVLNLAYDLTPIKYLNMVITEVGMIPPSSVPVIIREYRKEE